MQQREMRRTIPSIQRANDDEFTPDQRSVWAGNLVSCSSLATLGHSSMPGIRSAPDALVDRQRQLDRASPEELLPNAWFAAHSPLQKESRSNELVGLSHPSSPSAREIRCREIRCRFLILGNPVSCSP